MKKKLYDFSLANAIIVLSAYLIVIGVFGYSSFKGGSIHWISFVFFILLIISLAIVIWYYGFMTVTVSDDGVRHGHKFIHKKDLKYSIEFNYRFRYNEIIFQSKYVDYKKLKPQEIKKKQIVIQYFDRSIKIVEEYFGKAKDKKNG